MSRPFSCESAFRAIGHPVRRRILELLLQRERAVGELLEGLRVAKPTVSEHLRMLRHAGLISSRRRGRFLMYRLHLDTMQQPRAWLAQFERIEASQSKQARLVASERKRRT